MLRASLRRSAEGAIAALSIVPFATGLRITLGRAGFFGEVFCAINGLSLAKRNGLWAQMNWGRQSPYFDNDYVKNGDAWSSYFAVSTFDFRKTPNIAAPRLVFNWKPGAHDFELHDGLSIRRSAGQALRKWCQPQDAIAADVENIYARLCAGRPMLGVHVRRTDAAAGLENREIVELRHFFDAADSWLITRPEAGIFLATDESKIVKAFESRYGARVTYQTCLRSENGNSIHGHYDLGVAGSPYQKGREVLIDALLLARCQHLIRTHSRVTTFSLCWSPEMTFHDLEVDMTGAKRTPWLHEP